MAAPSIAESTRGPSVVRKRARRRKPGFTILELMTVMTVIGALAALGFPRLHDMIVKAKVARAIGDIVALERDLDGLDSLPADLAKINRAGLLDPWGNPYVYFPFPPGPPPGGARLDKFAVPVNEKYDLYSLGEDGSTSVSLTGAAGRDDVVRGSDGGYIGLGSKY